MTKCQEFQSEKTYKNPLDKRKRKCYNMQAVNETAGCQRGAHTSGAKDRRMDERIGRTARQNVATKYHEKKVKKLLKNLLTNEKRCDIMSNTSAGLARGHEKNLKKIQKTFHFNYMLQI